MPYTPPGPQSPVASRITSPSVTRSSSYTEEPPRSPSVSRPTPPRSHSSTSYLHKHRRSPSISSTSDGAPPTPTDVGDSTVETTDFASNASVRQSPPPLNNLAMPTGAVLSPPESPDSSDGEAHGSDRGRELEKNWSELQLAVRGINQKREGSPEKADKSYQHQPSQSESEPHSRITSPTALSSGARKIAHSRSSTENAIMIPKTSFDASSTQTTDESEEDDPMSKPALVRKKSGELVKPALRPSSRRRYSSMPGTPTYSKSVHFNDSDNQTRHFLQVDKPIAVSAGSSPVETYDSESEFPFEGDGKPERGIKLANFPADTFEHRTKPVRVERIFLSQDKQTLIGVVAVQNLSFQKLVAARFTVDYWKTTSEVVAEYNNDPRHPTTDGCDRFNFHIKLSDQANIDNKTLLLCVRYNVGGAEYWDNNNSTNYQVDFTTQKARKASKANLPVGGLGQRPLSAIPRSRHNPSSGTSSRGRRESIDDDFASRLDAGPAYNFASAENLLGESNSSIKLKPRVKRGSLFEPNTEAAPDAQPPANGLGGRYDFGASLSAALSTAQDKLGRQSGLMRSAQKSASAASAASAAAAGAGGSYFGPVERNEGPVKADERPDDLTTGRPAMGSDQYKDLVQKFCYFTTSGPTTAGKAAPPPPPVSASSSSQTSSGTSESTASPLSSGPGPGNSQADGSNDESSSGATATISSNETVSPHYDGAADSPPPPPAAAIAATPISARSSTPAPRMKSPVPSIAVGSGGGGAGRLCCASGTVVVVGGGGGGGGRAASPGAGYPYLYHSSHACNSHQRHAQAGGLQAGLWEGRFGTAIQG